MGGGKFVRLGEAAIQAERFPIVCMGGMSLSHCVQGRNVQLQEKHMLRNIQILSNGMHVGEQRCTSSTYITVFFYISKTFGILVIFLNKRLCKTTAKDFSISVSKNLLFIL